MDEKEPGATQDADPHQCSHHHHHENLQQGLLLGDIDQTLTDLLFGEAASVEGTHMRRTGRSAER